MFTSKRKKIARYLQNIPVQERTAFPMLLADYLDGSLKNDLLSLGMTKLEIHIDWYDDFHCIGVQGKCKNYYMDLQIYPNQFTIAFDLDEADDSTEFTLDSKEQFYHILSNAIHQFI